MTLPTSETPRRAFLQQLVGAGVAVAGSSMLSGCATAGAAGTPSSSAPASNGWDMSWRSRLGRYRMAFDSPEIGGGAALSYAASMLAGYKEIGTAASEVTPVLILRHAATVMTLNDAMWEKLEIGEANKLKDPTTGETAKRNPFLTYTKGDKFSMTGQEASLQTLIGQGAIVLACGYALRGSAYRLRQKDTSLTAETSFAAVKAAVIPGAYVMPNGIFAVSAAQDAGCNYMRVVV